MNLIYNWLAFASLLAALALLAIDVWAQEEEKEENHQAAKPDAENEEMMQLGEEAKHSKDKELFELQLQNIDKFLKNHAAIPPQVQARHTITRIMTYVPSSQSQDAASTFNDGTMPTKRISQEEYVARLRQEIELSQSRLNDISGIQRVYEGDPEKMEIINRYCQYGWEYIRCLEAATQEPMPIPDNADVIIYKSILCLFLLIICSII